MIYEEKVSLIEKITKEHPSYGVDWGFSQYVGGMADTGNWFVEKMLLADPDDLQLLWFEITKDKNTPPRVYTEQEKKDMEIWHKHPGIPGYIYNEFHRKQVEEFGREQERRMLYGGLRDAIRDPEKTYTPIIGKLTPEALADAMNFSVVRKPEYPYIHFMKGYVHYRSLPNGDCERLKEDGEYEPCENPFNKFLNKSDEQTKD